MQTDFNVDLFGIINILWSKRKICFKYKIKTMRWCVKQPNYPLQNLCKKDDYAKYFIWFLVGFTVVYDLHLGFAFFPKKQFEMKIPGIELLYSEA